MEIRVLFIQRVERYPNELAVEALAVEDEYTREENPEWFKEECLKQLELAGDDVAGSAVVAFKVDEVEIRRRCLGEEPPMEAPIVEEDPETQEALDNHFQRNADDGGISQEMLFKVTGGRRGTPPQS